MLCFNIHYRLRPASSSSSSYSVYEHVCVCVCLDFLGPGFALDMALTGFGWPGLVATHCQVNLSELKKKFVRVDVWSAIESVLDLFGVVWIGTTKKSLNEMKNAEIRQCVCVSISVCVCVCVDFCCGYICSVIVRNCWLAF